MGVWVLVAMGPLEMVEFIFPLVGGVIQPSYGIVIGFRPKRLKKL
jgi:hypothetical protein